MRRPTRLIKTTGQFERDYKRLARRGWTMDKLKIVMRRLAEGEKLEPRYRDHKLVGSYLGDASVTLNRIGCLSMC